MAENQKIGGYQCEFVGPVPEELVCKSCKLVARKPHTADCCEDRFCKSCIDPVLKDKKPCPSCGEAEFLAFFMKSGQRKILALQVHCTMKQRGCGWVDQLEQLDAHLDPECQYVDVECPSKCDLKVQKRNLATHLKENCPKRNYKCRYCQFYDIYEIVTEKHYPQCLYFPLQCPNACGVTCEREIMEDHMQLCSLEEVECELSYAGCKERFLRQDQDEHMQQNAMKHMSLMAAATLRISREFEQKLREKDEAMAAMKDEMKELKKGDDELKAKLEEKDHQIAELQDQVQQQLQEKDDEIKKQEFLKELQTRDENHAAEVTALKKTDEQLQQAISSVRREAGLPPYHRTLDNYTAQKAKDTEWHSEPFYIHPGGYKCLIRVWPNGYYMHKNYVSVDLRSAPGPFDDTLPWPAKATITVQLVNQHRDQDHVTGTERFEWGKPIRGSDIGDFSNRFIPHAELGWNAEKQTQYLKDDCLQFRVTKIELH